MNVLSVYSRGLLGSKCVRYIAQQKYTPKCCAFVFLYFTIKFGVFGGFVLQGSCRLVGRELHCEDCED